MKVQIVSDGHGNYAVRKRVFFLFWSYYLDFRNHGFWWTKKDTHFFCCWTDRKDQAEMWAERMRVE